MSDTDITAEPDSTEPAPADAVVKAVEHKAPASKRRPSPRGQAVSGSDTDAVLLASIVFKNTAARKSLSVHHMQRRLAELGYADAHTDKDGWYGDLTLMAVAKYQEDEGLDGEGCITMETLESLFADDANVNVVA